MALVENKASTIKGSILIILRMLKVYVRVFRSITPKSAMDVA